MSCLNSFGSLSPKKKRTVEKYTKSGEQIQRELFELRHGNNEPYYTESSLPRHTTSLGNQIAQMSQGSRSPRVKINRWIEEVEAEVTEKSGAEESGAEESGAEKSGAEIEMTEEFGAGSGYRVVEPEVELPVEHEPDTVIAAALPDPPTKNQHCSWADFFSKLFSCGAGKLGIEQSPLRPTRIVRNSPSSIETPTQAIPTPKKDLKSFVGSVRRHMNPIPSSTSDEFDHLTLIPSTELPIIPDIPAETLRPFHRYATEALSAIRGMDIDEDNDLLDLGPNVTMFRPGKFRKSRSKMNGFGGEGK